MELIILNIAEYMSKLSKLSLTTDWKIHKGIILCLGSLGGMELDVIECSKELDFVLITTLIVLQSQGSASTPTPHS
jgi:hypothetical protein